MSSPIGTIVAYTGPTDPPADPFTGHKYLICDGRAMDDTEYPDLFALIGTLYGTGDGQNQYQLPDLQGYFLRGLDPAGKIDPDKRELPRLSRFEVF